MMYSNPRVDKLWTTATGAAAAGWLGWASADGDKGGGVGGGGGGTGKSKLVLSAASTCFSGQPDAIRIALISWSLDLIMRAFFIYSISSEFTISSMTQGAYACQPS